MGAVSSVEARLEDPALRVVWQASEILWERLQFWHAVGWDPGTDMEPYRRWVDPGGLRPLPFFCEIREAGPYSITRRGPMAEKPLPRLRHRSGYFLLATFQQPSPQGPPHKLRVVIVDALSPQEQERWRKHLRYASNAPGGSLPHTAWKTEFQKYAAQKLVGGIGPLLPLVARHRDKIASRFGLRPDDLDRQIASHGEYPICTNEETTPADMMAHCLFLLWCKKMMPWEKVHPWLAGWWRRYTARPLTPDGLLLQAPKLAMPLQANALRPADPALVGPDSLSVTEAAERLGISPRQLRYLEKQGQITIEHRKACGPGAWRILTAEVERLANDPQFQDRRKREEYRKKGKARGLANPTLRKRISRGPRKPDNTPDWEALETRLKSRPAKRRGHTEDVPAVSLATLSREAREELRAELERQYAQATTEDERLDSLDKLKRVADGVSLRQRDK
jgi:hypothetical protein